MIRPFELLVCAAVCASTGAASSNIDPVDKFAWSENTGWLNWRDADAAAAGVSVLNDHLAGFIWGENIGWINTGDGNGPYANTTGLDFGVNILATDYLSGLAWGENVGWINFDTEPTLGADGARFDRAANRFRGYAWGENIGWINLDDGTHFVGVTPLCPGDVDGDLDIDFDDLNAVLSNWNTPGPVGDLNGSGLVDFDDLNEVLSNWGVNCS